MAAIKTTIIRPYSILSRSILVILLLTFNSQSNAERQGAMRWLTPVHDKCRALEITCGMGASDGCCQWRLQKECGIGSHPAAKMQEWERKCANRDNQVVSEDRPATARESIPGDCGKGGSLTRYLKQLQEQQKILSALERKIDRMSGVAGTSSQAIRKIGNELLSAGRRYKKLLVDFHNAQTRKGLYQELDLLISTTLTLNRITTKYQELSGLPVVKIREPAMREAGRSFGKEVLQLARERMVSRLKGEGLKDILVSDSWKEAVDKGAYHADRKVREFLERETQKMLGLGFYDLDSARRALRLKLRREIYRHVAKLLVKVTSNEIVIELVAGPIIRWIGRDLIPRLREALRHKGNLPDRVARSIKTMEQGRQELFKLPCNARISQVQKAIGHARGLLHAARFLQKDLNRALAANELDKFGTAVKRLSQAIHITSSRFLLDKDDFEDDLVMQISLVEQMLGILNGAVHSPSARGGVAEQRQGHLFLERQVGQSQEGPQSRPRQVRIPELQSWVEGVRFYADSGRKVPLKNRKYARTFPSSSTRFIRWELELGHKAPAQKTYFHIDAVWKDTQGLVIKKERKRFYIPVSDRSTYYNGAYGFAQPGRWRPGNYSVELFIQGKRVAAKEFMIAAE